ncbi:hypothetical protein J1N35_002202 [Gossypium stocksii]|uniref:Uncharacterized protein n=1 Tax=Gossypium stocksii TaxID=47602 RepID=A0A9D3WKK7_9ROSI|nr:hypothetical protein J1N35_002202 [Gossypium stocksii]
MYNFHNDEGYKTENYFSLKDAIKETIRNGEMKDFVAQYATSSGQSLQGTDKGKKEDGAEGASFEEGEPFVQFCESSSRGKRMHYSAYYLIEW